MRTILGLFLVGVVVCAGVALAGPDTQHGLVRTNAGLTALSARPCMYPAGGWTIIDCSNAAAASSAQLNEWSRYVVQCGDDTYFATGSAASGQDADSNDGWVPSGAWLEFMTTDTVRYLSVKNKTSDSDCRILECR